MLVYENASGFGNCLGGLNSRSTWISDIAEVGKFYLSPCLAAADHHYFETPSPSVTNASFAHQDFTNLSKHSRHKEDGKQLAFHQTSNTSRRTTSCSSQQGHSNLHSSTGDEDGRDDNTKKSNSSTSSSVGGTHTPDTPTHRDPRSC